MDSQTARWFGSELIRRSTLGRDDYCRTVLLSFPRSGNHLVRYLVEHGFGRPTLGARDREDKPWAIGLVDTPLFVRLNTIEITDRRPIMVKRHAIEPGSLFTKTVLIYRDPVEAIASHVRALEPTRFESTVGSLVKQFFDNVAHFLTVDEVSRLVLSYDLLASRDPRQLPQLNRLLGGGSATEDRLKQALVGTDNAYGALRRSASPGCSSALANPDRAQRIAQEIDSREYGELAKKMAELAEGGG